MIGAIAMGIGMAVALPNWDDEDKLLDRFEGDWCGTVHYSKWIQDLFALELSEQTAVDQLAGGSPKLPELELDLSIRTEQTTVEIRTTVSMFDPRNAPRVFSLQVALMYAFASRNSLLKLVLKKQLHPFLVLPEERNGRVRLYKRRSRSITWDDDSEHKVSGSVRREFVLEPVGDNYLALHVFSFQPAKVKLFTVYLWPRRPEATPTRSSRAAYW